MTVVGPLAAVSDYQQVCNLSSPDTERTRTHLKRRLNWLVYFTLAVSYDSFWGETTEVNIYKDIHLSVLKPRDCGRLETTAASHPSISALSLKDTSYILSIGVRKSPFSPSVCGIYWWQETICLQTALCPQLDPVRKIQQEEKELQFNHLIPTEVSTYLLQLFNIPTNNTASTVWLHSRSFIRNTPTTEPYIKVKLRLKFEGLGGSLTVKEIWQLIAHPKSRRDRKCSQVKRQSDQESVKIHP